ncbi:MAG: histidinol-phosphate transaminase, partial [Bacteroidota bacterium]
LGNRYGHGDAAKLIDMVAEKEGVTKDHILLGPGSTDILEKTAIVHFIDGGNVVAADPAYMSLIKTAMAFKAKWKSVPCTDDWAHDLKGMEKAIDADTKLVYICNPNNPTGSLTDSKKLYDFCSKVSEKVPVFVDEAYLEFLPDAEKHSMVKLVQEGKNVIVARTFSKIHGMAGLRMGYGVALPETLEKIQKMVRTTMGLNVTTLRGAMASLKDEKFQENSRSWTAESREFTIDKLKSLGYDPIPSYTSFVLFPLLEGTVGKAYLAKMFDEGIGVRFFEVHDKPYCRVSMGTMEEMKMFVDAFKKVVG